MRGLLLFGLVACSGPDAEPGDPPPRDTDTDTDADADTDTDADADTDTDTDTDTGTTPPPDFLVELGVDFEVEGTVGAGEATHTLFTFGRWEGISTIENQIIVVDAEGQVVWWYTYEPGQDPELAVEAWPLPDGSGIVFGGGGEIAPTILTWEGKRTVLDSDATFTHDMVELADGRLLAVTIEENQTTTPEGKKLTWPGSGLVMFDPLVGGGWDPTPIWSWSTQTMVEADMLPPVGPGMVGWHANGVTVIDEDEDGSEDLAILSIKELDILVALELDDPKSDGIPRWRLNGGTYGLFSQQHAPQWHPPSGLLWLYDNAPETGSRGLALDIDLTTGTASEVWSWMGTNDDGSVWREPLLGDVDPLPNDNRLVTMGHCNWCGDAADPTGRSTIVEVTEAGEVLWSLQFFDDEDAVYRAERFAF